MRECEDAGCNYRILRGGIHAVSTAVEETALSFLACNKRIYVLQFNI
jgi:hypothetical protein